MDKFLKTRYPALYKSKKEDTHKGYKYLARLMVNGTAYRKVLGYSKKNNLTDRGANVLLSHYKDDIESDNLPTRSIKLDKLFSLYYETLKDTNWSKNKQGIYDRYIKKPLGHKSIDTIKQMHIKKIIVSMDKNGYKPRTQKSILEVLKPMYKFALSNKIAKENPTIDINVKIPSQKKIVTNATELLNRVYIGISSYYHDNPYYKALFLFGFTGRRKSEILNLQWENIDLINNYYWIENTKNDDKQKYQLPPYLKQAIQEIKDNQKGLVFKSFITGKVIINIDRQMKQLRAFIGIDNLTLHYMRNILVSALAEQQIEAITLSGILGHR